MPKYFKEEGGVIPILVLVATFGLVTFLIISNTFNFKDKIFSSLFSKPPSSAAGPGWKNYDDAVKEGKIKPASKILQIQLHYDENSDPKVSITGITKMNGYMPTNRDKDGYEIQLLDANRKVLFTKFFKPPNLLHSDYRTPGGSMSGSISQRDNFDFSVTIPAENTASDVEIMHNKVNKITSSSLKNSKIIDNKPNFRVITGEDFLKNSGNKQGFNLKDILDLFNPKKVTAQLLPFKNNNNGLVDFTFIGNKYSSADNQPGGKFDQDVQRMINQLKITEPFKTRFSQSQLRFIEAINQTDLGCVITTNLTCNWGLAQSIIASGAPQEEEIIIDNDSTAAGGSTTLSCTYDCATGSNSYIESSNISAITNCQTVSTPCAEINFIHEVGHSLGKLYDEYTYPASDRYSTLAYHRNCYHGNYPDPETAWQGIPQSSYFLGCSNPSAWRSSSTSVMEAITSVEATHFYNQVSINYMNQALDAVVAGGSPGGIVGGTGGDSFGSPPGTSCSDPIKPNDCTCTQDQNCNSGYCSSRYPKICTNPPPGYGTGSNVCYWTNWTLNTSSKFLTTQTPAAADTTPPTTIYTLSSPAGFDPSNTPIYTCGITGTLTCNDNTYGSGCNLTSPKYCFDSTNTCAPNATASISTLVDQQGTVYGRAQSTDKKGNLEAVKSKKVIIDRSLPKGIFSSSLPNQIDAGRQYSWYLQGVADDISGVKKIECWFDYGLMSTIPASAISSGGASCTFIVPSNATLGNHNVTAIIYDNAGWKITPSLVVNVIWIPPYVSSLNLTRYVKYSAYDYWTTTSKQQSPLSLGYVVNGSQGSVFPDNGAYPPLPNPTVELYDCLSGSDHVPGSSLPGMGCSSGSTKKLIGYLFPSANIGTYDLTHTYAQPLYRCYGKLLGVFDNYTSLDLGCENTKAINLGILGWVSAYPYTP